MRALAWLLVTVGCARQPMRISTGRDVDAEMHEMRAVRTQGVPLEVTEFRAEVRRLADDVDPRHEQTVQALRLMARAVRVLSSGEEHAQRIELQSAGLEHSHENAVHSDFAGRALVEATRALDEHGRGSRLTGWPERIGAANSSVDAIDPTVPYLRQRRVIDRAFLDVANAFVVATAETREAAMRALGERTMTLTVHRWAAVFTFGWYTPVHVRVTCPYGESASR